MLCARRAPSSPRAAVLLLLLGVLAIARASSAVAQPKTLGDDTIPSRQDVGVLGVGPLAALRRLVPPPSSPSLLLRWAQAAAARWAGVVWPGPAVSSSPDHHRTTSNPGSDALAGDPADGSGGAGPGADAAARAPGLGWPQELTWQGPTPGPASLGFGACYDAAADGLDAPAQARGGSAPSSGGRGQGGGEGEGGGSGTRPPVVFLPPLTGTELQARLEDKPANAHWWCARSTPGWFRLWPSLQSLLPGQFACYVDNLRLVAGPGPDPARPPLGVAVRVGPVLGPGDGGGAGPSPLGPWDTVCSRLKALGWGEAQLKTHAYDWRLSPASWRLPGGAFWALRAQIEAAVAAAGGRRAVLLGLSLGGSYGAAFLGSDVVDEAWKAKHVEKLVTISGVWGGTPRSVWDLVSGRLEGLETLLDRAAVRALMRGLPSLAWTFPSPDVFPAAAERAPEPGAEGQGPTMLHAGAARAPGPGAAGQGAAGSGGGGQPPLLVNTALGRSYGAADMGRALGDAGAADAAAFWAASLPYITAPAPNVTTHCFYSYGLPTAASLTYAKADFSDQSPAVRYSDGDVTVPYASLAACRGWAARQSAPVHSYSYYGVVHAQLTDTAEALDDIVAAIAGSG
ncbi:hypothetical protein HYH03_017171 [Edaphochlamys debaryana]|uniref:Uncharacterized protein n=1 Tax=Edaphochlamys debaryana TaxID=47281 RepID=A0A835XIE9_9CHLO|nr:hypothetical protein HYH03_017171 [Edaphochlamys debaryana]|eukprot:KAG2484004.1 hypothetical protein HYH03_017171 [Edaphochlamys debaryana]